MDKIILTIELTGLDGWSVNWNDEKETSDELIKLRKESQKAISDDLGINLSNVSVNVQYNPQTAGDDVGGKETN